MLIAMMVAMLAVAAIPAVADQVQVAESGDVNQESYNVVTGWYNVTAVENNQSANTGNYQEQISVIQYGNDW